MIKKIFEFIIFSNLFIAVCAVAMVLQTYQLVLKTEPNSHFIFFVFFSTLCSYSFHWWLSADSVHPSSREKWVHKYRIVHAIIFFIGLAGSLYFFLYLTDWWYGLAISATMTFLYSAPKIPHPLFRSLRKLALGKTIFLALVWMMVTTFLPVLISEHSWSNDIFLFLVSRFFLIYAICILFDYRDRDDDKAAGVRSLVTYLNEKGIRNLFIFSLSVFLISTILLYNYNYSILNIGILLVPGFITAVLYDYARRHFSDILYYFVLDGLMALSGFVSLCFSNRL